MIFYFAAVAESHTAAKYFCLFDKSHGINRSAAILKKGWMCKAADSEPQANQKSLAAISKKIRYPLCYFLKSSS